MSLLELDETGTWHPDSSTYAGPSAPAVVVVGERYEKESEPFTSAAGECLRILISDAGFNLERVGFTYDTELLPPSAQFIILSGDRALHRFRPDLWQRYCHGRIMCFGERLVMPLLHHVAVHRFPEWRVLAMAELVNFKTMAADREHWLDYTADTCVWCRREFFTVDDNNVVRCETHSSGDPLASLIS